ncbi:MAG: hypothetical protein IPN53_08885 [Comamonadaceae bacterium]|nr:hypothetical protein [Comamonadaceae bacterium]
MISSLSDVYAAYDAGRSHTQRFIKTGAGQVADGKWQDWAFQAGQPGYDARIGRVAALTPVVAQGNDAIYLPPIAAGQQRMLHRLTLRPQASQASQASINFVLYDLVAYYPLIDGDSADPQDMDNALTLPRYADGAGLRLVMVNHVAPAVANGIMTLDYTDSTGVDHSITLGVPLNGINVVCSPVRNAAVADTGPLTISLDAGVTGVRRVNRVTYLTPPGGLHCLYLVMPLAQFAHYHDALLQADTSGVKSAVEVDFAVKNAGRMPIVKDGAHLAFFYRPNGGGRTATFFGDATFIWS